MKVTRKVCASVFALCPDPISVLHLLNVFSIPGYLILPKLQMTEDVCRSGLDGNN